MFERGLHFQYASGIKQSVSHITKNECKRWLDVMITDNVTYSRENLIKLHEVWDDRGTVSHRVRTCDVSNESYKYITAHCTQSCAHYNFLLRNHGQ